MEFKFLKLYISQLFRITFGSGKLNLLVAFIRPASNLIYVRHPDSNETKYKLNTYQ